MILHGGFPNKNELSFIIFEVVTMKHKNTAICADYAHIDCWGT